MSDIETKTLLDKYYGWLWSGLGLLLLLGMLGLGLFMLNNADLKHDRQISQINNIKLIADFEYADISEIKTYLQSLLDKEFVDLDLAQVESMLKKHPWVRQSVLQKKWPDALLVKLEEQVPVVILKTGGYLNSRAEVFDKEYKIKVTGLPLMESNTQSYADVLKVYAKITQVLESDQKITHIKYNQIGSYDFDVSDGGKVILGRRQIDKRIKSLPQILRYLKANKLINIKVVDMRYRNAVAVKLHKHNPLVDKEQI